LSADTIFQERGSMHKFHVIFFLILIFLIVPVYCETALNTTSSTVSTEDLIKENDLVLANSPDNLTALMYRALIYYNGEKYPDAIASAENVLKLHPECSFAWHVIGSSWGNLKDYIKAAEAFAKASEISPDDPAEYNLQGVALFRLGKNQEAVDIFRKALVLDPDYSVAWNNLGVTYKKMDNIEQATHALNTAIDKDPKNAAFFSNKGYVLLAKNDYSGAINAAISSKKIEMTNVPQWFVAADAYYAQKDYKNAFYSYDGGFTTMEKNNLWFYQGVKNSRITSQMEPVSAYYESVSSNVRFTGEWDRMTIVEYKLKRYKDTLDVYDQVIVINPDLAEGWRRKGYCALKLERYESAGEAYKRALEIIPEDPDLLASYGYTMGKLGDYLTGMNSINKALEIDDMHARAYMLKGEIHAMYGERKEATEAFNQALIYDPHNSDIFDALSAICMKNGDYIGAVINYFRGIIGF
jgi:tetratricopeptide (TPR) repeat protein